MREREEGQKPKASPGPGAQRHRTASPRDAEPPVPCGRLGAGGGDPGPKKAQPGGRAGAEALPGTGAAARAGAVSVPRCRVCLSTPRVGPALARDGESLVPKSASASQ